MHTPMLAMLESRPAITDTPTVAVEHPPEVDESTLYRFDRWPLGTRGALIESHSNGRRHGWSIAFHDNGNKACEGAFVDGVESGWWVFWNEDGSPAVAIEFEQGVPCRPILRSGARVCRAA
jgi:hypothetical protein